MSEPFRRVVGAPDPMRVLSALHEFSLCNLIDDLSRLEEPNEFQARVFGLAMGEAVTRWMKEVKEEARSQEEEA